MSSFFGIARGRSSTSSRSSSNAFGDSRSSSAPRSSWRVLISRTRSPNPSLTIRSRENPSNAHLIPKTGAKAGFHSSPSARMDSRGRLVMKACCQAIAISVVLVGCDEASRSIAGPLPPGPQPDTSTYTVSGRVQDIDGAAIPGAVVTLENQIPVRAVESDESGHFRFEGVRGLVAMRASKGDFTETALTFWVATDQMLSVTLQKALRLIPGVTLRGIIQG